MEPMAPLRPASGHSGAARVWVCALVAGAIAGLGSWLGGEATLDWFPPELRKVQAMGGPVMQPTAETLNVSETRQSLLAHALLGGLVGLCFGLAGGLSRGTPRAGLGAGLVGLALGTAVGAALTLAWLRLYYARHLEANGDDLVLPMLIHGGIWAGVGAVGGWAFGAGQGGYRRGLPALLGGLLGALLGTALFDLIGAGLFPLAKTSQPIAATWPPRLLARMLVTLLAAAGAALAVRGRGKRNHPQITQMDTDNTI